MNVALKRVFTHGSLFLVVLLTMGVSESKKEKAHERWEKSEFANWRNRPNEKFKDGPEIFDQVKKDLLRNYFDQGLTEDDLYRAAVQGMLSNIDPPMSAWNRLMTPTEYDELRSDMQGKVVGIGVEISFNDTTGYGDVLGTVPGTPSAKAGLVRGDQILKIDGKGFKGRQLRDMVYAIRGKEGTEVKLSVLHDDKIRDFKLRREALAWDTVESKILDGNIGLVSIHYFIETTPKLLAKSLNDLKAKKISGLIVDLRGNEGGVFERAIESIRQFVPKDKLIVNVIKRGGAAEKIFGTSEPLITAPLVVLMNGSTKSGAEVMAAALKISAAATTVGTNTFGKWSAQKVDELPNKFAIKYTTSTFLAPDGRNLSGIGLNPDITVDFDEDLAQKLQKQPDIKMRLQEDIQLQTAVNIFKLKN